jgi:hypothetical protein
VRWLTKGDRGKCLCKDCAVAGKGGQKSVPFLRQLADGVVKCIQQMPSLFSRMLSINNLYAKMSRNHLVSIETMEPLQIIKYSVHSPH